MPAGRPRGSGRNLTVNASVRLTPTEAAQLRQRYGSLSRALRAGLNLLPPPPRPGPAQCPACGQLVERHREGWFYDHCPGRSEDLCPGSGAHPSQT